MQSVANPPPLPVSAGAAARPPPDFEAMYAAQFDYVARTLRRLGARPSDLEDLCQEVFLAAFFRRGSYDSTRPIRPWLFGIAFRALSQLRNRAQYQREIGEEGMAETPVAPHLEEAVATGEARQLVLSALPKLPAERRAVFILHDLDECGAPEISAALGIPLNTVYSRLRVAREEFVTAVRRISSERGEP